jgi:hypothetical protein
MTVDRIQEEVRADDPIQKFQGRWIGADGWEFPVHARYVAWAIFGVVLPLVLAGDWLLTGEISPLPLIDLTISVGLTTWLANLTSGEVSLSHAVVYLTRTVRSARQSRRRSPRPRTTRDRLGRLSRRKPPVFDRRRTPSTEEPEPAPLVLWPARTGVPPVITGPAARRKRSGEDPSPDTHHAGSPRSALLWPRPADDADAPQPAPEPFWPPPVYGPTAITPPGQPPSTPARFDQNQGRAS